MLEDLTQTHAFDHDHAAGPENAAQNRHGARHTGCCPNTCPCWAAHNCQGESPAQTKRRPGTKQASTFLHPRCHQPLKSQAPLRLEVGREPGLSGPPRPRQESSSVALTPRLSCGARAPQRLRPRPPARRRLQPVVRRHVDSASVCWSPSHHDPFIFSLG